jgi:hypothetical protein
VGAWSETVNRILLILVLALSLAACSGAGSQYLGQWENIKDTEDTFSIVRNGEGFLIVRIPMWGGKQRGEEEKIPAILKDGLLQIQSGRTIAYIKESDTLTMPGPMIDHFEYKRKK